MFQSSNARMLTGENRQNGMEAAFIEGLEILLYPPTSPRVPRPHTHRHTHSHICAGLSSAPPVLE